MKKYALMKSRDGWRVIVKHPDGIINGDDGNKYRLADFRFFDKKVTAKKVLNELQSKERK